MKYCQAFHNMACINSEIDEISIFNSNFIQVEYQWITGFASFGAYPSKSLCFWMNKNRKWKIPHSLLERRTLCFRSYTNRVLKVRLWRVRARERRKRTLHIKKLYFMIFLLVFKIVWSHQFILKCFLLLLKNTW